MELVVGELYRVRGIGFDSKPFDEIALWNLCEVSNPKPAFEHSIPRNVVLKKGEVLLFHSLIDVIEKEYSDFVEGDWTLSSRKALLFVTFDTEQQVKKFCIGEGSLYHEHLSIFLERVETH